LKAPSLASGIADHIWTIEEIVSIDMLEWGKLTAKKTTMDIDLKRREATENPSGRGWVFQGKHSFVEVFYDLHVFKNVLSNGIIVKQIVTGKIRPVDKSNILWGTDELTLHLQDNRLLDFLCVNFTPECEISSVSGFYS